MSKMLKALLRDILKKLFFKDFQCDTTTEYVGGKAGYHIKTNTLNQQSPLFVLSAGVGFDIDFELELSRLYPLCKIILLDPSPDAIATIASLGSELPNSITFEQSALSCSDGLLLMAAEAGQFHRPGFLSNVFKRSKVTCHSRTIKSILNQNRVSYIDILKLDIEGFEYSVLFELLNSSIGVGQICVELHDWMLGLRFRLKTFLLLRKLRDRGFFLAERIHNDYTFVHESLLRGKLYH